MERTNRDILYKFLEKNQTYKGQEFNITSIYDPTGSFYIGPDDLDKFYLLYKNAVSDGADLYLTEKHRDIGPIVIDLDFRFPLEDDSNISRQYTKKHVKDIMQVYCDTLKEYIKEDEKIQEFEVYVLEKPAPVTSKGLVKDGIHLMIPDIVTRPMFQLMLREKVLEPLKEALNDLPYINDIKDVVDEAVIEKNNWQMLGSKKPHCEKYTISSIYKYNLKESSLSLHQEGPFQDDAFVETLSIRNKYIETNIKFEKNEDILNYEKLVKARKMQAHLKHTILSKSKCTKQVFNEDDYNHAKLLVSMLSGERADSYTDWMRVGWCLKNIDHRLCPEWVEFSKKSRKYKDGECEKCWDYMRQDGACLGMGTLHLWAKTDSPDEYGENMHIQLRDSIKKCGSGTEYDVACVIQKLYNHRFIYDSRNKLWYAFYNHRWHLSDEGFALKRKLPTDVSDEFKKAISWYMTRSADPNLDQDEKERCEEFGKKLAKVLTNLKKASFQSSVMTEAAMLFNVEKIDEKFDSNTQLIGFENGVYDLDALEFRDGRPEDYITISTGINYIEYDTTNPYNLAVIRFLAQVIPNENVREYVLRLFASFLHGNIREERFHVWTGSGSNGKSAIINFFQKCFGEYCCTLPIALLTQKRGSSSSASPELSRAKSKRFACLQEPGESERLNIGLMKEMTGGDKLYSRGLYREGTEWKPQFKMILTCNHLPVVPSDDGGTWRRIRVVRFESRFCESPDPTKPNEFPMDPELSAKFDEWKEPFMSILIEYYKKIMANKVKEPDEVLECTREYQRRNDIIMDFLDNAVEKNDSGFLAITDAFMEFKMFLKEEGVTDRGMRKADFQAYIEKMYGKPTKKKMLKGWVGYRLRSTIIDYNNDDDYD